MMLILKENEVYFIDRENYIFTTDKFYFPRRKNPDEHVCDTLVDGELVSDGEENCSESPVQPMRLLVSYDDVIMNQ